MVRGVAIVIALLVIAWTIFASRRQSARLAARLHWMQVRFQLDPPSGDEDWIGRRLRARDRGGLLGIASGAGLAIIVALVTNPRTLAAVMSVGALGVTGWWIGQVVAETIRAKVGGSDHRIGDFFPRYARGLAWVMRLLPFLSIGLGIAYRHPLAGISVAVLQVLSMVVLAAARRRSLHGREFGLTARGALWARALHGDALRLQYLAEAFILGWGTSLLAFYLYEFTVATRDRGVVPLGICLATFLLTVVAALVSRILPTWAHRHAWSDEPAFY